MYLDGQKRERKNSVAYHHVVTQPLLHQKFAMEETTQILKLDKAVPFPTPLCKHHYHKVYDALQNKQTHCCTCGSSLRSEPFRVCPNAVHIHKYLTEKRGFEGNLSESD